MLEALLHWDKTAFYAVNVGMSNSVLDTLMLLIRNKYFWAPLYTFLLFFLVLNYRWKGLIYVLGILVCFGLADTLSSKILKPLIKRPRPCHVESGLTENRLLLRCRTGYSFTSSHATNHWAMAWFLFLGIGRRYRWARPLFLLWASLVCLAQVYVGLHFPLDVIAGAFLGTIVGILTYSLFSKTRFSIQF